MKTTIKNNFEAIREYIDGLDNNELVNLHNQFCQNANYPDDEIYTNDEEFFEIFFTKPIDAVRAASYGDYNFGHDWVKFNGYGNLESFDNPFHEVDMDTIANHILENAHEYDIELEEEEENEEE